jgi:hypothetical protein
MRNDHKLPLWGLATIALLTAACGSDSGGPGCLTDAEICQFKRGVSAKADVEKKLGHAQQYLGTDVLVYVCQQVSGNSLVHNDIVAFEFDDQGLLAHVSVIRQGSGATPPPDCIRE